jgi:hypothetical protein
VSTRRHIKRATVLWLGLFTALAAGGFLMSRRSREADTPAPKPVQVQAVQSCAAAQPAKRVNMEHPASQPAKTVPDEILITPPVPEESGYEIPFSSTNKISANTSSTETDPAKLDAALMAAAADGNVRDIAALLHSGNPASEIEAIRILARIGSGEALAAALGKLLTVPTDSPDYNKFIGAFADCHSTAIAEWLTATLGQAKTEDVRQRVLTILAALRGPEVVDSLAASLASPMDAMHAKDCAELLAKVSDPEQAALLRALLETGKSTAIQTSAACGLASVGSGEACEALIKTGSSTESIASACRDALATVDSSYGQAALILAAVSPSVPSAVRCAAVQALSNQPGQRVQTVLVNLSQATSDSALQTAIGQALQTAGQSGTPPQSGSPAGIAGIDGELWF